VTVHSGIETRVLVSLYERGPCKLR